MSSPIEVRVHGRGRVRGGSPEPDGSVEAKCDLCGVQTDAVASVAPEGRGPFACKSCLRERLEGITVSLFMLKEPGGPGLPWGKISG
jgi:hypothetical protein